MRIEKRGNCPFCDDTKGHLYQNTETECWICFKCGKSGKGDLPSVDWIDERQVDKSTVISEDKANPTLRQWYRPIGPEDIYALQYLKEHHISPDVADKYGVGLFGSFLVFPVMVGKRIVFYQTRHLTKKKFKNHGNRSWALPIYDCALEYTGVRIIVESIVSALRLCRFFPTIALCGKQASHMQITKLRQLCYKKQALIWLDAVDSVSETTKLILQLREWCKARGVFTPIGEKGVDPCDLSDSTIISILSRVFD